jgi:hypothetical protein
VSGLKLWRWRFHEVWRVLKRRPINWEPWLEDAYDQAAREQTKDPCLYPLPDGRRCAECAACQQQDRERWRAGELALTRKGFVELHERRSSRVSLPGPISDGSQGTTSESRR